MKKNIDVVYCEHCRIPLTKKLLKEIDGKKFCYYCARRYLNKLERRQLKNGIQTD